MCKSLQGRFLFERIRQYGPEEAFETSWRHPITGFEPLPSQGHGQDLHEPEPAYEALSYVWGPPGHNSTAYVKRSSTSNQSASASDIETLPLRLNLATALRHLRKSTTSRTLWIDAICINQEDTVERGIQVQNMGNIYRLAREVIVWLGPEQDNSKLAISTLTHLGCQLERLEDGDRTNPPDCDQPTWSRPSVVLPYDDVTWEAVASLLRRQWFRRLWTWQEVQLASEQSRMYCGHDQIPLRLFKSAVECGANKRELHTPEVLKLFREASKTVDPLLSNPFLTTLLDLNQKECTDDRDRIYGALGMAPPSIASKIIPRYALPVEEVFKEACVIHLQQTRRVEFLNRCDLVGRRIPGPTWVPDWSARMTRDTMWLISSFQASSLSTCSAEVTGDRAAILGVRGVKCGTVQSVTDRAPTQLDGLLPVVRKWECELGSTDVYVTGEHMKDAFIKTICCCYVRDRYPTQLAFPSYDQAKSIYYRSLPADQVGEGPVEAGNIHGPEPDPITFAEVQGRRFITTDSGHIGITPAATRAKDIVCVLLGCPWPMILRPHLPGGFQVVGSTYVHGVMNGESLLGPLPCDWEAQVLTEGPRLYTYVYYDTSTGEVTREDPRLESLPPEWERFEAVRTSTDPLHYGRYRRKDTGEVTNGDPRLLPEQLRQRGVQLDMFPLV
ncbi:HET-domain-containing protein [Polychaeton citri CBS 116435]|uniref:HET-domain-containing protein n=1 Tax=Polychaeton citri CBS 116435 TaxID=1314669 RepID=A0A9P4Q656_9PEZI|nr:HET-domain-containing protein [Polychaeton citri CBS 116435]